MSTDLSGVVSMEVLRGIREGDVVWVTVHEDLPSEEINAVQGVLGAGFSEDVSLIVTRRGYVDSIHLIPLSELLHFREVLDSAIASYAESHLQDVGA
jgi:hypothetical protein